MSSELLGQIETHRRNLADLEAQKAAKGLDVEPELLRRIEHEQAEIERLVRKVSAEKDQWQYGQWTASDAFDQNRRLMGWQVRVEQQSLNNEQRISRMMDTISRLANSMEDVKTALGEINTELALHRHRLTSVEEAVANLRTDIRTQERGPAVELWQIAGVVLAFLLIFGLLVFIAFSLT